MALDGRVVIIVEVVEDGDRVPPRQTAVREVRSDEPGPPGDEDLHCGGGAALSRSRLLLVVAVLDAPLLAVADQPLQELRVVDSDDDVVGGVVEGGVADELPERAVPAVELCRNGVEVRREVCEVLAEVAGERLVVQQDRE